MTSKGDSDHRPRCPYFIRCSERWGMAQSLYTIVGKFVRAGEQAGFSVEQMIQLLQTGASVETLLKMIEWRLSPTVIERRSSRWIA